MSAEYGTWAKRGEPHSTPETRGTRCDGCGHLSCIENDRARVHRWGYYCDALFRRMTLKELYAVTKAECPEHREVRRRFR